MPSTYRVVPGGAGSTCLLRVLGPIGPSFRIPLQRPAVNIALAIAIAIAIALAEGQGRRLTAHQRARRGRGWHRGQV